MKVYNPDVERIKNHPRRRNPPPGSQMRQCLSHSRPKNCQNRRYECLQDLPIAGDNPNRYLSIIQILLSLIGTPYYASPEVWKDKPYGKKSDIWSLGCVFYEMLTKHPPFRASSMKGLYQKILKGKFKKLPYSYSDEL